MRADNYALCERLRDQEQARSTDEAYAEAIRLLEKHRPVLDRIAKALEKETLKEQGRAPPSSVSAVEPESRSSETMGTVRVVEPSRAIAGRVTG